MITSGTLGCLGYSVGVGTPEIEISTNSGGPDTDELEIELSQITQSVSGVLLQSQGVDLV